VCVCVWLCTSVYFTDLGKKKKLIFCKEDIPRIMMLLAALLNMSPMYGKYMNFFTFQMVRGVPCAAHQVVQVVLQTSHVIQRTGTVGVPHCSFLL